MSIELLNQLKDFLADRPAWAFLALSLVTNGYLFILLQRAQAERLEDMRKWLPVASKLGDLVSAAANKARKKTYAVATEEIIR